MRLNKGGIMKTMSLERTLTLPYERIVQILNENDHPASDVIRGYIETGLIQAEDIAKRLEAQTGKINVSIEGHQQGHTSWSVAGIEIDRGQDDIQKN